MHRYILLILLFIATQTTTAQPKHEVRAAWLTTAYALDWPRTLAGSPEGISRQKAELVAILDKLQQANINTVLFQARTRGDVFYHSAIEPFSALLTGKAGGNPGYDPLAFAIDECHKRGMECHAWMVAIPLGTNKHVAALGAGSVTRKQPDICLTYKGQRYLNPGHPDTKLYLMKLVEEVVKNYDVDGIHLDYLRYPERAPAFPDGATHRKYGRGQNIAHWRRNNVTNIVRFIYKGVKELKPWVKVSTCPVGKYDDTKRFSSLGWNAFGTVFQDAKAWMNEGIQDQLYPMLYFKGNNFYPFALDWQEHNNGRHIVPGLGIYFLDPAEGDWTLDEVERQINFTRHHKLAGQGYYRSGYLMKNTHGVYDCLLAVHYQTPALVPPMPWIDAQAPTAPKHVKARRNKACTLLEWEKATDNDPQNEPFYVVYGSNTHPVDTTNPANIIAQRVTKTSYKHAPANPNGEYDYYAVTAVDRCGNESKAAEAGVIVEAD